MGMRKKKFRWYGFFCVRHENFLCRTWTNFFFSSQPWTNFSWSLENFFFTWNFLLDMERFSLDMEIFFVGHGKIFCWS